MARINIEECWWSDPRRSKLARLVGSEDIADGRAIRMWRLAQEFWKADRSLVPLDIFETLEGWQLLIDCRLAEVRDGGVYVRGSSQYLDWTFEKREAGKAGGKVSSQRPRDEKGRLLPKQGPSSVQAEPKQVQPSGSVSGSGSGSEENTNTPIVPLEGTALAWRKPEFDRLAKRYRSEFSGTTEGSRAYERFCVQFKTPESVMELDQSLTHYRQLLNYQDWRQAKTTFETYLGTKRSGFFWKGFIEMPNIPLDKTLAASRSDEIDAEIEAMFQKAGNA